MVGIAGRSRGCSTCRRRRVKCDQVLPTCGQCRRGRRVCSGPLTGPFFIISTAPTPMFDSLFIAHFISSFSDPDSLDVLSATAWIQSLPSILSTTSLPPVKLSIRATIMALYGTLTGDLAIQSEAYRWYTDGLKTQREALSAATPPEEAVCAPIMLSYFEIVNSTTPEAWMLHMEAAATMLEMLGPAACRVGFAHQILRTVRLGMVYVSMTNNKPPVFASETWKTVPFETDEKTPWDALVDIFLSLSRCLHLASEPSGVMDLRDALDPILSALRGWWEAWSSEVSSTQAAAAHVAMFNTAKIVALSLYPGDYSSSIKSASNTVLQAAESLGNSDAAASWSRALLMVFPLKAVAIWCPDAVLRGRAVGMLRRWGPREGLRGICTSGAPFVEEEEERGWRVARYGKVADMCRNRC